MDSLVPFNPFLANDKEQSNCQFNCIFKCNNKSTHLKLREKRNMVKIE